jgi:hypothetical protein
MGSDTKKTISFSVDSAEEKEKWNTYAKLKGFQNASVLARVALYQYMARHPLGSTDPSTKRALKTGSQDEKV